MACARSQPGKRLAIPGASALPASASSHVMVMVLENEESSDVLNSHEAPYLHMLLRRYGLATNSFAIRHPSLPNYLALISGSTLGITSDCTSCTVNAPNIVDQLEAAHISWKAYMEDAPTSCYRGSGAGNYAKKHNPFVYFEDIAGSSARCHKIVGFPELAADLRRGRLPTYVWVTPNLCDDGHDCGLASSDRFLAHTVPALLRELGPQGFLVITWDEGDTDRSCCGAARGGRIATLVAGPTVRPGARLSTPIDHYGTLATIEQALGLPLLGGAAGSHSGRLTTLFSTAPHIR
jgi:hypothetical protein